MQLKKNKNTFCFEILHAGENPLLCENGRSYLNICLKGPILCMFLTCLKGKSVM